MGELSCFGATPEWRWIPCWSSRQESCGVRFGVGYGIVAKPVNASANRIDFLSELQKLKAPQKPSSDRIEILTGSIDSGNL